MDSFVSMRPLGNVFNVVCGDEETMIMMMSLIPFLILPCLILHAMMVETKIP